MSAIILPKIIEQIGPNDLKKLLAVSPILAATFAPIDDRVKINATIIKSQLPLNELTVIIDHYNLYSNLKAIFSNCKILKLGFNASLPLFELKDEDPYLKIFDIVEAFKLSFHISEYSARILQYALASLATKGNITPSIEEVILEVESRSQISIPKIHVARLLRLLDLMSYGRIGAAFCNQANIDFTKNDTILIIDVSHLPREFKTLASFLILMKLPKDKKLTIIIENADLMMPELMRALREEFALAFERTLYTLDILDQFRKSLIILSCRSPIFLSTRARFKLKYAFASIPKYKEDFDALVNIFLTSKISWREIKNLPQNLMLIFQNGELKTASLSFTKIPSIPITIEEKLKPHKIKIETLLEKVFRGLSEAAYQILSFLLQGSADRDTLLGYAIGILGLNSEKAQRILGILSAYGLISDVIGRDGKHYLKITPSGIAALNEYSSKEEYQ